MAKTNKVGVDYFPFNVGFFDDDKIELIQAEFGVKGVFIAIKLLCKIYKQGYYYQWGEDECLIFSKNAGAEFVPSAVNEVVNGLVRRCLFDKGCFDRFRILTSAGIQKRYFDATARYKNVDLISEYLLIKNVNRENVNIYSINANINPNNDSTYPHNENESENENEIKEKEFARFWDLYGKKVDHEKSKKKFLSLSKKDRAKIFEVVDDYVRSAPDIKYRKNPLTWLNGKCWNDEIKKTDPIQTKRAGILKKAVKIFPDTAVLCEDGYNYMAPLSDCQAYWSGELELSHFDKEF